MKKLVSILAVALCLTMAFAATPITVEPEIEGSVTGSVTLSDAGLTTALALTIDDLGWNFGTDITNVSLSISVDASAVLQASLNSLEAENDYLGVTWYSAKKLDSSKYALGWFNYFDDGNSGTTMVLNVKPLDLYIATQEGATDKVAVNTSVSFVDIASQLALTTVGTTTTFDKAAVEVTVNEPIANLNVVAGVEYTMGATPTFAYVVDATYELELDTVTLTPEVSYGTNDAWKFIEVGFETAMDPFDVSGYVNYRLSDGTITAAIDAAADFGIATLDVSLGYDSSVATPLDFGFLAVSDDITFGPLTVNVWAGSGKFDGVYNGGDDVWGTDMVGDLVADIMDISAMVKLTVAPELGLEAFAPSAFVEAAYHVSSGDYMVAAGLESTIYDLLDLEVGVDILPTFDWYVMVSKTVTF